MSMDPKVEFMVGEWWGLKAKINKYKPLVEPLVDAEKKLRLSIVAVLWPADKPENEGTQRVELGSGYKLKANVKIDRKVLKDRVLGVLESMKKSGMPTDDLINWEPQLNLKAYRALTAEQQKVVEEALEIKPASPTLELEEPKKG